MRHEVRPHGLAFLLLSRWDELVCFCPLSSALVEEIVASWDGGGGRGQRLPSTQPAQEWSWATLIRLGLV